MKEKKLEAPFYGQIELIPGTKCDSYVLNDNTAVMSENGLANLLCMDQAGLNRIMTNWPPNYLEPFIDKGFTLETRKAF